MLPAIKRTRIEDLRRTELIGAAHRVFMLHGLDGMTTARICQAAGLSPGILLYYFKGKDDVLFQMVRYNNRLLVQDIVAKLRLAQTRMDRLTAIVEGNFPVHSYQPTVAMAWVSVCAAAAKNQRFAKLQRIFYRRLHSNLASVFTGVVAPSRASRIETAAGAMLDGLWLRKSAGDPITRDEAIAVILTTLTAQLSDTERFRLSQP